MRCGTAIAVLVLATGVMCGRAAVAEDTPPAGESKPEATAPKSAPKPKAAISVIPWRQAELKPEHALLKGLAGHWTSNVHIFEGQFARARDTVGTADGKLLMGGLFVELTQTETRMEQAFEVMTIYGYNEALNKYTADTIDTTTTGSIHFTGTYDAAKKQLTMSTRYTDGKMKSLRIARTVTTFVDEKTWTYEEFVSHGVGQAEKPVAAITFKRP